MALISIPGITENELLNTSTEARGHGLQPFPCDDRGYTRHTASVLEAKIKTNDQTGKSYLIVTVSNGQFGGDLMWNLDPTDVVNAPDPAKTQEQNLESLMKAQEQNRKSLMKAIAVLGIHTGGKLDTAKVETAGRRDICVEVSARHKGFRKDQNGNHYHKVSLYLDGAAKLGPNDPLPPVTGPALPPKPGQAPQASSAPQDDIPF